MITVLQLQLSQNVLISAWFPTKEKLREADKMIIAELRNISARRIIDRLFGENKMAVVQAQGAHTNYVTVCILNL